MANPPPPYDNITGISRAVMKDNAQETLANYNGNARPGELVVDLTQDPPPLYVGNNAGQLTLVTSGGGGAGLPLANGTSNFNIATSGGNATVTIAGTHTWTFDTTGNVTVPGDIIGTSTIDIDNRATGNSADINLFSADDILLQARDRTAGSTSEGGDINIFAGDSAEDGDNSGGDVVIEGGRGGASNLDFGGSGGFIRIEAGQGGDASTGVGDFGASSGGSLTLRAGDAGSDMGNIARGASGGDVYIESGYSTGNINSGGDIFLNTATGGPNGTSGAVIITIPSYGNTTGGNWRFNPDGSTIYPNLTVTRGDRTGTLTGQTLLFGDSTQGVIISTPNGTNDINDSQRLIINPGAGYANTTGEGGDIYLYAGRGGDAGGSGGDIKIRGGLGPVDGYGGYIDIVGGEADGNGLGGYVEIQGGQSANAAGGFVRIVGGQGLNGGEANLIGGVGIAGSGGAVNIAGGTSSNGLAEYGNVNITSGASTWTFDNTGNLTFPGGDAAIVPDQSGTTAFQGAANTGVVITSSGNVGSVTMSWVDRTTDLANARTASMTLNSAGTANAQIQVANLSANSINTWTFGANGNLITPGSIVTAGGSGGNITGANIITANTIVTTPVALANLTAVAGARAFVNNANLAASANTFGAQISGSGSNTVPVWSDGTNWYIG